MDVTVAIAPLVGWMVAGTLKFAINTLRAGTPAFADIGYGGLPSTHTTVVTTTAALVAFRDGLGSSAFGVAVTLAFIVVLDAMDLRRRLEGHARALNRLRGDGDGPALRERLGHRPIEVAAGVVVGCACGWALARLG